MNRSLKAALCGSAVWGYDSRVGVGFSSLGSAVGRLGTARTRGSWTLAGTQH